MVQLFTASQQKEGIFYIRLTVWFRYGQCCLMKKFLR
ncbi:hypothetical protein SB00094_03142 [Klebsiella variicola subsp. tropica]|nr:Uncharacterised protein [Klebsiella variicola]VGP61400.1 hypothetical protein SB00094_03142 [Klebsiella variicola subsp. tropica]